MADDVPGEFFDERSLHVHQAAGMIAVQANCEVEEALGRLAVEGSRVVLVEPSALEQFARS